jgi:DNA-binding transcriptional MerR regulator
MMTVHEVAKLAGISVRTLHYYDEIGLLRPDGASDAGYRLYGETSTERLQQILFFRELGFPLQEITAILNAPNYDKSQALANHKRLLMLKRERLDGIIALVDHALKGEDSMSIKEFDMKKIDEAREQYAEEAKARWGSTDAYKESEKRTAKYTKEDWAQMSAKSEAIFKNFAELRNTDPASDAAQSLVRQWKEFLCAGFYDCTDEILAGLGEMYVADARFTKNLDAYGEGTALFMRDAIRAYVKGK